MKTSILAVIFLVRNALVVAVPEHPVAQRYQLDVSEALEEATSEQHRNYARGDYGVDEPPPENPPTYSRDSPEPTQRPCPPNQRRCGAKCIPKKSACCPRGQKDCHGQCVDSRATCCGHGLKSCHGQCIKAGAKCCRKGEKACHGKCIRNTEECCKSGPCPKETCQPGLQWAYYKGTRVETTQPGGVPYNKIPSSSWYTSFDIQLFLQGQTPYIRGITKTFGLPQSDSSCQNPRTVYGSNVPTREYSVVQHIGYFHPNKVGTYTFTPLGVDEAVLAWFGSKAKSGFTNTNMDVHGNWNAPSTHFTYHVKKVGECIPFRMLWANAQGCNGFSLLVNDPDGVQVVSREKALTDNQFVFGCGAGSKAPPFNF